MLDLTLVDTAIRMRGVAGRMSRLAAAFDERPGDRAKAIAKSARKLMKAAEDAERAALNEADGDKVNASSIPNWAVSFMSAVEAGQQFGAWTVALVDPTGKRATVVCQCGGAAQIAVDALLSGESKGCGCRLTPRPPRDLRRPSGFSTAVARDEVYAAVHRHKARP
jgi:hypothetical protein